MNRKQKFALIPPVHMIQKSKAYQNLIGKHELSPVLVKEWVQDIIETTRQQVMNGERTFDEFTREDFLAHILASLKERATTNNVFNLKRVLNGTGTVLHTNLGRARLSKQAIERVVETSKHYSNLEYNIEKGERGSRHAIIEGLIQKVTGAEAAMAVNNNASAVYMILRALTKGKEVVVSRGELVEIGGSFRVSTIMEESDATLVEVGTTNKTHPYDYEQSVTEKTAMFMKVHTSNFKTVGFTKDVSSKELQQIAQTCQDQSNHSIIVYEDLGSGSLYPFKHDGIGEEPVVKEAIKNGADIVSFSGDKLLGGPQAGIIAGKKELIDKLKKHPLARVLRLDKMTLAALEATIYSYLYEDNNQSAIPTKRDILQSVEQISKKVSTFLNKVEDISSSIAFVKKEVTSQVGGGTMPAVEQPSVGLQFIHDTLTVNQLDEALRQVRTPVISRVVDGEVFVDFCTIAEDEIDLLIQSVMELDERAE
ncbi:L-seryl-tRNA(Sec) selenium transferase [Bacillus shivajii]|uniref:L-seryl-tRNA(Sec) selenium transferase n=1 Tax=Bacillus shivajii TaxID=1983719 RepID=UPI001CFB4B3E|nr:L-seryl-tRNA(Sec) selenium transferase [Bacillus shivajii]UCZ51601.1 L-seryl-tRNA(Sec) selenium transferase [Bacillus shivajii]